VAPTPFPICGYHWLDGSDGMIELFLKKGVRVVWKLPPEGGPKGTDGSILTRPATADRMTYDGVDGSLQGLIGRHQVRKEIGKLNLKPRDTIPFDWLDYVPGHTAKAISGVDILTGPMSGCFIASWTDSGGKWVGHLGTVVGDGDLNTKVRNTCADYLEKNDKNARGYNPADVWPVPEISQMMSCIKPSPLLQIMSLVTSTKEFWSLLLFGIAGGKWIIGGCRKAEELHGKALIDALRKKR
jgi:hypothetical protein